MTDPTPDVVREWLSRYSALPSGWNQDSKIVVARYQFDYIVQFTAARSGLTESEVRPLVAEFFEPSSFVEES
jgi:hypothetical protein